MSQLFYGDWMKIRLALESAQNQRELMGKVYSALEGVGKYTVNKIRKHIRAQDLEWAPLSSATIRSKGFDKVYIEKKQYYKSIKYEIGVSGHQAYMDIFPDGDHYSGLPMQELADYLEYGTTEIPSRPLWRPVFSELERSRVLKKIIEHSAIILEGMK